MSGTLRNTLLLCLCLLPAALVAALAYELTPIYIGAYAPFKPQIPPQTLLLFAIYNWLWVVPFSVVFIVWFKWPNLKRRALAAGVLGVVSAALVLGIAYWAVFQPDLILASIRGGVHAP